MGFRIVCMYEIKKQKLTRGHFINLFFYYNMHALNFLIIYFDNFERTFKAVANRLSY